MGSVMATKDTLTPRQDAFARHVAMGTPLGEAYLMAGYRATGNDVYVGGSKLAKVPKILTKIDQVRADMTEARRRALATTMIVTASTISEMLATVFANATKDKQHGAAATAAMGLAKVHGLLVDKTEDVTRRAARSPDAPIEIEVEHWLTEQTGLPSPANGAPLEPQEVQDEPAQRGTETVHQSPEGSVPQTQGSEASEPSEKADEVDRFIQ